MTIEITQNNIAEIDSIIQNISPGDNILFSDEIFFLDKQVTIQCSGNEHNPIVIGGASFEKRPIFDFRNEKYGAQENPDCNGFRIIGENLIIQNMIIRYSGFKGLRLETTNSTISCIETYGCCDSGIHMVSGGNNKIINCDSHDNFGYKKNENKYRTTPFGFSSDGISDKLHRGGKDIFIGCRSWNNTDDGYDFYGRECVDGEIEMHNCWAFNNGVSTFDMTNYPRYDVDKEWFEQFKNGKDIEDKKNNTVKATLADYPAFGNGNGFKLGGILKENNISLFSCISIGNKGKGFDQNNNSGNMYLKKCYAAENGLADYGFRLGMYGFVTFEDCESRGEKSVLCKSKEIGENHFNTNENTKYTIEMLMQPRNKDGGLPILEKSK